MADKPKPSGITSVLQEKRLFARRRSFPGGARIKSMAQYPQALQ